MADLGTFNLTAGTNSVPLDSSTYAYGPPMDFGSLTIASSGTSTGGGVVVPTSGITWPRTR